MATVANHRLLPISVSRKSRISSIMSWQLNSFDGFDLLVYTTEASQVFSSSVAFWGYDFMSAKYEPTEAYEV